MIDGTGLSGNHEQHRGHSGAEQLLRRHRDQGQTHITLHAAAYGINLSGTGSVKIEEEAVVVSTGTQPAISGETIVISGNTEVSANSSITADKVLTITDQAVVTAQDTLYGDEGIDILNRPMSRSQAARPGLTLLEGPSTLMEP